MIGTIGSLVEEATDRKHWPLAASLYIVACLGAAALVGTVLSAFGHLVRAFVCPSWNCAAWPTIGTGLVGLLALAYAAADLGLVQMPRPTLMQAVPVTWWRRWSPPIAALAYGGALGLGLTTRIHFGAFYVVCALAFLRADPGYGALVLGVYGAARALVLLPASWGAYRHRGAVAEWLATNPHFDLDRARRAVATASAAFGAYLVVVTALGAVTT